MPAFCVVRIYGVYIGVGGYRALVEKNQSPFIGPWLHNDANVIPPFVLALSILQTARKIVGRIKIDITLLLAIVLVLAGFGLLIKGADWLVKGASDIAKKNQVSELTIGLTIVAFGTSAPELVVNVIAATEGHGDIVFGNVIGSNIFNLFFILGLVGVISPIKVQTVTVTREIPISLGALIALWALSNYGFAANEPAVARLEGVILLLFFGGFLYYIYLQMRQTVGTDHAREQAALVKDSNGKLIFLIVIGLAGLVAGGKLVVDNAVKIATLLGVSQKMIALTIVAAGTSLPELVTSVVAATQKKSDLAVGNIIGSNIFNILLILSLSSVITPIPYNIAFNKDMLLLGVGTIWLLFAMFTGNRRKLDRWEGAIFVLGFIGYTLYLIAQEYPDLF